VQLSLISRALPTRVESLVRQKRASVLKDMALLHMRGTLSDGDDVVVNSELNGHSSSPPSRLEVVGVQGRVHEMVLRFSASNNGVYLALCSIHV